jgi:hypothetical protein
MAGPLQFRRRFPFLLLILFFVFSGALTIPLGVWFALTLTPLQKQYFGPYAITAMPGGTHRSVPFRWVYKTAPKRQPELAHDADVVSATKPGNPALPLNLSPDALAEGWTGLVLTTRADRVADSGPILQEQFFDGKSMARLMLTPLFGVGALVLLAFAIREWFRRESRHEERHGRRTKGPELVSEFGWKRSREADGIRLRLEPKWGVLPSSFCIPRKLESSHILLMGDTGSGKSNAIRQILRQVEERGESAIVYDPAAEFVQEFYRPERGDLVLNPLDERCPYWSLPSELHSYGIADAIAAAMLPEKEHEPRFFTDAPRRVLSRLLNGGPSVQQLLEWMADPAEIDRRLEGTPQAAYLDPKAAPQRGGVLASLNMIADSLALLPEKDEKRGWFETGKWGFERTQWVFMTSKPAMRERILPLHSVWLDLLILRMMEPCANPTKPVWFVLDELASLNKLPQLHTAVTENRKYGNPVVLGFQGRSQLEKRYGQDAEAMLSQPATKIFFKTSEPRAAKWISETLGEIEVERLKESRTPGLLRSKKNFAMEIATKPLVMASEIAGLDSLRGYIKQENRVLPVKFALTRLKRLQPEFIARKMTIPEPRAVPPPVPPPLPAAPLPKVASPMPKPAQTKKPVQLQVVFPEPPPADAPVPPKKPIEPEKPRSPFGQKQGTIDEKPRDWDESQWIE